MIYVGLDVSLNSVAVCAVDETAKLIREGTTLADAPSIVQYLEPWAGQVERVGLEAGPMSEWLTAHLIELGLPAVSLEARQVKAVLSAMPVKTDRNDARGIAQVDRTGWFKPVHVKSISSQRARTLAAARKHIIRSIDDAMLEANMNPLLAGREALMREYSRLHRLVLKVVCIDPACRLLMTMPGIGPVSALTFRSTVDDPRRFLHSQSVGAYLGLTPRRYQSGEVDRVGRITKVGDGETRTAKEASVRRSRWPERWLSSFTECGLMEPNSDGWRWRKDAVAIPRDARRGARGWSSLYDLSWRPPSRSGDYAEELEPTIQPNPIVSVLPTTNRSKVPAAALLRD